MVLGGGGFIVGSEGCWWVVVGLFWVVGSGRFILDDVGGGGFTLDDSGWKWAFLDNGGS